MQIVLICAAGMAAQWVAWRMHIPAIIFLLAFGFVLGPVGGLIQPDRFLGPLLQPAISAAVALILFEGSLQLRFKELRETRAAVRQVIFIGAPLGWALISLAGHFIAGLSWPVAVTLGGILVVTGPTVIMPMLRHARLDPRVGGVLKWEGIVNDPLGVIFAILTYEFFVARQGGESAGAFLLSHGLAVLGVAAGSGVLAVAIKRLFDRGYMPEYLKTPFLVSVVLSLFFGCNILLHELGLIGVTVFGLMLANIHTASLEDIKRFKENITILLVSGVFLLLTADLDAKVLLSLDLRSVAFIAALLFVVRPLTIALCGIGSNMTKEEILLAGLIAPRGVVCAAMAGVIGPLLTEAGWADGERLLPIAFALVIVSVVLHSLMIGPLARRLGLTSEESNGVIIAGAYAWSIQLAQTLKARGVPVLVADNNWHALAPARLADLPVYYGELLSEETEFELSFNTYNTVLAATHNPAYNALVCEKFGYDFDKERVYRLSPDDSDVAQRRKMSGHIPGRVFMDKSVTLQSLYARAKEGWRFRTTRVGKGEEGLILPDLGESCLFVGIIGKSGLVRFAGGKGVAIADAREDDYAILFEKEAADAA